MQRSLSSEDSLGDINLLPPMAPIHYDPILPQESRLPPIMVGNKRVFCHCVFLRMFENILKGFISVLSMKLFFDD